MDNTDSPPKGSDKKSYLILNNPMEKEKDEDISKSNEISEEAYLRGLDGRNEIPIMGPSPPILEK